MKPIDELDREHFQSLKTYIESYSSHLPVRRVTVIANAPLEPSAERAGMIDSSDLVFRCNSFVLDEPGDEPCLGTKTDVVVTARATRPTPWFFRNYSRRAYLVIDAGNPRARVYPTRPITWPDDLGEWPISNRVFGIPLKKAILPEDGGLGAIPTTGTEAAYVAHELFPDADVTLCGFSFLKDREQTHWAHHYGTVCPVHPTHLLDREGALLQSWVDAGTANYVA